MAIAQHDMAVWRGALEVLKARLGMLFGRRDARRQAGLYVEGLLSAVERKNGWQVAEAIGDARPWRTQRVLSQVQWDQDATRDLCRDYVLEHLGDEDGVLVVDESGFLYAQADAKRQEGQQVHWRCAPVLRHRGADRVRVSGCAAPTAGSVCSWPMPAAMVTP